MAIQIVYKPLFEVKILHHYFLDKGGEGDAYVFFEQASAAQKEQLAAPYDVRRFLTVTPSPDTVAQLKRHQCIFKASREGFVVMVRARYDEAGGVFMPFAPLAGDVRFRFEYRVTDPLFLNYTSLPLDDTKQDRIFYFENKANGSTRRAPNLSTLPPIRVDGQTYNEGEILRNSNASNTLIANRITDDAGQPKQEFTTDFVVGGAAVQYANANDAMKMARRIVYVDSGRMVAHDKLTVTVVNEDGKTVRPPVTPMDRDTTLAQVDLSGYAEGVYRTTLADDDAGTVAQDTHYVVQRLRPLDGVITIHARSDAAAFELLTGSGALVDAGSRLPLVLRFKNRATLWRYKGEKFSAAPTSGPHLLTRQGFVHLTVDDDSNAAVNDPPNATPAMLVVEKPAVAPEHYNLYSDIFFNT